MDPSVDQRPVGSDLAVRARRIGAGVVLSVTGEVDLATAEQFQAAFDHVAQQQHEVLVVDLTGVGFLSSVGLRLLLEAHEKAAAMRVVASETVERAVEVAGLHQVLAIHPTVEDALRH
jgi:anti-sigma B factor antagonist